MNLERLQKQLTLSEGCPENTYLDTKGILTGGIGHNLIDEPDACFDRPGIPVPQAIVKKWFEKDIQDAISDLDRELPWWTGLDDVRQNALLDLCFNMGINGLLTFKNTLAFLEAGEYIKAANGIRNSKYALDVGPVRSGHIAHMIQYGEW